MRIISKFNDYYDGVQAYGQDQSLVYHRVTEERNFKDSETDKVFGEDTNLYNGMYLEEYTPDNYGIGLESIETFFVGICGIIYPLAKLTYGTDRRTTPYPHRDVKFTNSSEGMLSLLKQIEGSEATKLVKNWKKEVRNRWRYRWFEADVEPSIEKQHDRFFDASKFDKYWKFSVDHKIVCFSLRTTINVDEGMRFTINPCLKDLGAVIVSNPFDTFQNIAMYLGGVLGNEAAPMIAIEDKYRIESHGYDKWSFRKRPTKNK